MDAISRSQSSNSMLLPSRQNMIDGQEVSASHQSYGATSTTSLTELTAATSSPSLFGSTNSFLADSSPKSVRVKQQLFSTTQLHHHGDDEDRKRIYRVAEEAGISSFGIIAVDVWWIEANDGQITHSGVLWTSPTFCWQNPSEALDRLVNPKHPRHVQATPQVAGAGLVGYYLARGADTKDRSSGRPLEWTNLQALTSDPFQPPYERMVVLENAGFGKVTGIPFETDGHHGMVLYFARATAVERMLNEPSNVNFLHMATKHIGTASALSRHRLASMRVKSQRVHRVRQRVRTKFNVLSAFMSLPGSPKYRKERQEDQGPNDSLFRRSFRSFARLERYPSDSFLEMSIRESVLKPLVVFNDRVKFRCGFLQEEVRNRLQVLVKKAKGSTIRPPPQIPWTNTAWTFVGAFLTFLMLIGFRQFWSLYWHGGGKPFVLAPFGALLTLQYSLTAAPAAQPRTILYGQVLCLGTALMCQYVGMNQLHWSPHLVLPFAGALGIAIMAKFGIPHPPAAASMVALLDHYIPGETKLLTSLGVAMILIFANILAIATAIFINNLSEQRQYPVYWAMTAGFPSMVSAENASPGLSWKRKGQSGSVQLFSSEDTLPLFTPFSSPSDSRRG